MLTNRPKIAVIVLNWNGKQDTLACLESLEKLSYSHYEVIIVDNGSSDGSPSAIRKNFPQHLLIENGRNLGFAEGNNVGIRTAMSHNADLFFLLNNDTIVAPDLLDRIVEMAASCPEAGIFGAKICRFDQRQIIDHLGGMWNRKNGTFTFVGMHCQEKEEEWQKPQEIDYVCGAGLAVKRNVIETIGYLDPRFFLIWEESDFCFRAHSAGFKVMTCPQAKLWHKISASFVGGKVHSTYFWWRNRLLWIEKNCSFLERLSLYLRILIPDILNILKKHMVAKLRCRMGRFLRIKRNIETKNERFYKNRAALHGVRDYLTRRFGKGPDWIRQKQF